MSKELPYEGWIKLHRKFTEWEWFDDANMLKVFIFLLLNANHKKQNWRGIEVDRGQYVTGLQSLSKKTNLSIQKLRTCLKRFEKTGEINRQTNNQYSVITVCKYEDYQGGIQEANKQLTNEQQATNKQSTANKNDNNDKNENYNAFIQLFNGITKRNFKGDAKSKRQFSARLKDGYHYSDFKKAITNAKDDKYLKDNPRYLTPEYITRSDKLEQFINIPTNTLNKGVDPAKFGL